MHVMEWIHASSAIAGIALIFLISQKVKQSLRRSQAKKRCCYFSRNSL